MIADLHNQLSQVTEALGIRIGQALATVQGANQTDITGFLAFVGQGDFSIPRAQMPNLVNNSSGLLIGFTTFLVSEALVLDGWHAVASLGTDPLGLHNDTAPCPWWIDAPDPVSKHESFSTGPCNENFSDLGCTGYDHFNQCDDLYWWYSQNQQTAYTLSKDVYHGYWESATKAEKDPTENLNTIFTQGWSTGELLLENAGRCIVQTYYYNLEEPLLEALIAHPDLPVPPGSTYIDPYVANGYFFIGQGNQVDEIQKGLTTFKQPNGTFPTITRDGIDFNCTSQLNLTVLTDWPSVWYLHRKF